MSPVMAEHCLTGVELTLATPLTDLCDEKGAFKDACVDTVYGVCVLRGCVCVRMWVCVRVYVCV